MKAGDTITCLVCKGSGYTTVYTDDGTPYPAICHGCKGTGEQEVKPERYR